MNLTRLSDYLQNPTESQSQSHLDSALKGMIRVYLQLSMNLNDSHFSFPRCPLRAFCGSSSSNNNKNKTPKKNEHPLLKSTNLIYVWQHVNCVCAFVKGSFFNIKIDCAKIGENRGSKDISYSPFYGTGGRDPGNMWIVSIRLVVSCFCFGRVSRELPAIWRGFRGGLPFLL